MVLDPGAQRRHWRAVRPSPELSEPLVSKDANLRRPSHSTSPGKRAPQARMPEPKLFEVDASSTFGRAILACISLLCAGRLFASDLGDVRDWWEWLELHPKYRESIIRRPMWTHKAESASFSQREWRRLAASVQWDRRQFLRAADRFEAILPTIDAAMRERYRRAWDVEVYALLMRLTGWCRDVSLGPGGKALLCNGSQGFPPPSFEADLERLTGLHVEMLAAAKSKAGADHLVGESIDEGLTVTAAAKRLLEQAIIDDLDLRRAKSRISSAVKRGHLASNGGHGSERRIDPGALAAWMWEVRKRNLDLADEGHARGKVKLPPITARPPRRGQDRAPR